MAKQDMADDMSTKPINISYLSVTGNPDKQTGCKRVPILTILDGV